MYNRTLIVVHSYKKLYLLNHTVKANFCIDAVFLEAFARFRLRALAVGKNFSAVVNESYGRDTVINGIRKHVRYLMMSRFSYEKVASVRNERIKLGIFLHVTRAYNSLSLGFNKE